MTQALSQGYKTFGDWSLAAGAYNTGTGTMHMASGGGNLDDVTSITNGITGSKSNDVRKYMLTVRGAWEGEQFGHYHKLSRTPNFRPRSGACRRRWRARAVRPAAW